MQNLPPVPKNLDPGKRDMYDWADKVKSDVISAAIDQALGSSASKHKNAPRFENGGTGDAMSQTSQARGTISRASKASYRNRSGNSAQSSLVGTIEPDSSRSVKGRRRASEQGRKRTAGMSGSAKPLMPGE